MTVDMIAGQLFVPVGLAMCSRLGLVVKYELTKMTEQIVSLSCAPRQYLSKRSVVSRVKFAG